MFSSVFDLPCDCYGKTNCPFLAIDFDYQVCFPQIVKNYVNEY